MKTKKRDVIKLLSSLIEKVINYRLVSCNYQIDIPVDRHLLDPGSSYLLSKGDYIISFKIHLFKKSKQ